MSARTAADKPEAPRDWVNAAALLLWEARTVVPWNDGADYDRDDTLMDARLALSVVPAPLLLLIEFLSYIPNSDEAWAHHVLTVLRYLGVGLPARAEPSDAAVDAFKRAWSQASEENDIGNRSRRGIAAAYAVDRAK